MNHNAQATVAQALQSYSTGHVNHDGVTSLTGYHYPWWDRTVPPVYYTFNFDADAKIRAVKAILKLSIADSDKLEAVQAILGV